MLLLYVRNFGTASLATRGGMSVCRIDDSSAMTFFAEGVDRGVRNDVFKLRVRHQVHSTYLVTGSVAEALKSGISLLTAQLPAARPRKQRPQSTSIVDTNPFFRNEPDGSSAPHSRCGLCPFSRRHILHSQQASNQDVRHGRVENSDRFFKPVNATGPTV